MPCDLHGRCSIRPSIAADEAGNRARGLELPTERMKSESQHCARPIGSSWHDTCSSYEQSSLLGRLLRCGLVHVRQTPTVGEVTMLWTIFVVLLVLWFLGVVSSYTLGGFIHLLLVLAVIAVLVQLISGRRTTI
jgi:hypothetical protein